MSGIAAARAHALRQHINREKERIINLFASSPYAKPRATTKVVKSILLDGPYLLNGRMWEVKTKSLGAGVYELSIERLNKEI